MGLWIRKVSGALRDSPRTAISCRKPPRILEESLRNFKKFSGIFRDSPISPPSNSQKDFQGFPRISKDFQGFPRILRHIHGFFSPSLGGSRNSSRLPFLSLSLPLFLIWVLLSLLRDPAGSFFFRFPSSVDVKFVSLYIFIYIWLAGRRGRG